MAKKHISSIIRISATAQAVWDILTDFTQYHDWNPFIIEAEGLASQGETLTITAGGMKFKPTVLVADRPRELRWLGKLFVKGLFDGEHIFSIVDHQDGTVSFTQEEYFTGLLVGLFSKKLDGQTLTGFQNFNEALKSRAES